MQRRQEEQGVINLKFEIYGKGKNLQINMKLLFLVKPRLANKYSYVFFWQQGVLFFLSLLNSPQDLVQQEIDFNLSICNYLHNAAMIFQNILINTAVIILTVFLSFLSSYLLFQQLGNSGSLSTFFTGLVIWISSATLVSAFLCSFILYFTNTKDKKIKITIILVILNAAVILLPFFLGLLQIALNLLT